MDEILTQVSDSVRSDGQLILIEKSNGGFLLETPEDSLSVVFDDVDCYIEKDNEWAELKLNGQVAIYIQNNSNADDQLVDWPNWLFEEFASIAQDSELRPVGEYNTMYSLKDVRGIKAAE